MVEKPFLNRRQLLGGAAAGSVLALGTGAQARSISGEMPWRPGEANRPDPALAGPLEFFTQPEATFIDAAIARLIPNDDLGPGAREAGVLVFLDRQMAGDYGRASRWYMQGPWKTGEDTQGYQSRMTPAELYRAAIKAIDDHCRSAFAGKAFSGLSEGQQDSVLSGLENETIELSGVSAKTFFDLLLQNTIEGFFSDPLYGGNRDMAGWKLIGFPGARYDYRPYVDKHGVRLNLPPVGITGRPGWAPGTA